MIYTQKVYMSSAMFPAGISNLALMNSTQGRKFGCSGNKSLLSKLSGETQYGDDVGERLKWFR